MVSSSSSRPPSFSVPHGFTVLSDNPSVDGPDALEFEAIAQRLERIIVASRESTPFTASIEAGWGSGKSSLMRRVQRRLEGRAPDQLGRVTDARTVWFNAWTAPETQVLEGLVRSVLDQLDTNLLRRLARKRNLIRGVGFGLSVVASVFRLGDVVDRIWDRVSVDPKQRNELNDFVREAMQTWLDKSSSPGGRLIVVFIDDLDRCTPATVLQVFEAMKLYLDAPGFVFVLGWDTEQVLRAVASEKGADDRLPQRYVEKIVQFGFRIPRPTDEQLVRLADTLCEDAGLTTTVLGAAHRELLISTTGGNPRQLKRFINRFILLHEMVGDRSDAASLIQLMVLQSSYDNFFRLLATVPGDDDVSNPLFEFSEYATARQALGKAQLDRVTEMLAKRGYETNSESVEQQFARYVADLPADYPFLAIDRQFAGLVLGMPEQLKRDLRSLARSDEVRATNPSVTSSPSKASPRDSEFSGGVAPGTTVLWVDDDPKPADQAVLPNGVNLIVATSTDDAVRALRGRKEPVALLISDVGRGPARDAGIDGLRAMRKDHIYDGPAIFYTTRPTSRQVGEARELMADITSSPDELRSLVERYLVDTTQGSVSSSSA